MKVVNIRNEKCDVYIGRQRHGHHFGNPFSREHYPLMNRDERIGAFRLWITEKDYKNVEPQRREWILKNLHQLHGKLGCYCKPKACHGDVYLELIGENND